MDVGARVLRNGALYVLRNVEVREAARLFWVSVALRHDDVACLRSINAVLAAKKWPELHSNGLQAGKQPHHDI